MKPHESTIQAEYSRIKRIQGNSGLEVDHVAICNVVAAKYGYQFKDVLALIAEAGA